MRAIPSRHTLYLSISLTFFSLYGWKFRDNKYFQLKLFFDQWEVPPRHIVYKIICVK